MLWDAIAVDNVTLCPLPVPGQHAPVPQTSRRGTDVSTPPDLAIEQLPTGPTTHFDGSRPVTIGREGSSDVVVANDRTSRRHATISFDPDVGWVLEDHSSGGTYVDGARVTHLVLAGPVVVTLGTPGEGASLRLLPPAPGPPIQPAARVQPAVQASATGTAAQPLTPPVRDVAPGADSEMSIGRLSSVYEVTSRVRIGRAEDNDIVLPDLLVSHHHAELHVSPDGRYEIEDLQSHNGTFVDGRRVRRRQALSEGSIVSIGHHLLCLTDGRLQEYIDTGEVSFAAVELSVLVGRRALLDKVSFPLGAGDFLAVLGPTGAGKSTLLKALTGYHPADTRLGALQRPGRLRGVRRAAQPHRLRPAGRHPPSPAHRAFGAQLFGPAAVPARRRARRPPGAGRRGDGRAGAD